MKKIYSLLLSILPMLVFAQPTITETDLPVAGVGWLTGHNASYTGSIPAGGPNQTWDYSSLVNVVADTTAYGSVTGTPYVDSFPTANSVGYEPLSGTWNYYASNSTGFYFDGGFESGEVVEFNPPVLYVPVPLLYTNSANSTSIARVGITIDTNPARVDIAITTSILADGWGSLTTPTGTYPSTLREKVTQVTTDSTFVDYTHTANYIFANRSSAQTVTYRWLRHAAEGTTDLLTIVADSAGTTATSSDYYISNFNVSVNNLTSDNHSLNIYPNPASGSVHFDMNETNNQSAVMKIYNSLGQQILSMDVKGLNNLDLSVERFDNGIYYYSLISENNKVSGNFSVEH